MPRRGRRSRRSRLCSRSHWACAPSGHAVSSCLASLASATADATTNAILELADHLAELQVEKVVLESTPDYWWPFFYLLEAAGLNAELVNARDRGQGKQAADGERMAEMPMPTWKAARRRLARRGPPQGPPGDSAACCPSGSISASGIRLLAWQSGWTPGIAGAAAGGVVSACGCYGLCQP